jgi:sterol 24-C-methyltransferase
MNMSALASGSFDGAYQIEATCHAPDIRGVYAEIFRVLKPGGCFASYEWCTTDAYDESNAEHRACKHDILLGNGLPDLRSTRECLAALKDVGFEVSEEYDLAAPAAGGDVPWYAPIDAAQMFSVRNFRLSRFGRAVTHYAVWALEAIRIAPPGTVDVSSFLVKGADALVAGGKKEVRNRAFVCAHLCSFFALFCA